MVARAPGAGWRWPNVPAAVASQTRRAKPATPPPARSPSLRRGSWHGQARARPRRGGRQPPMNVRACPRGRADGISSLRSEPGPHDDVRRKPGAKDNRPAPLRIAGTGARRRRRSVACGAASSFGDPTFNPGTQANAVPRRRPTRSQRIERRSIGAERCVARTYGKTVACWRHESSRNGDPWYP